MINEAWTIVIWAQKQTSLGTVLNCYQRFAAPFARNNGCWAISFSDCIRSASLGALVYNRAAIGNPSRCHKSSLLQWSKRIFSSEYACTVAIILSHGTCNHAHSAWTIDRTLSELLALRSYETFLTNTQTPKKLVRVGISITRFGGGLFANWAL